MTDILLITIIISLVTLGLRIITDKGMIGWPVRKLALDYAEAHELTWKKNLMKPVIICCVCMTSVWGLLIHLLILGFSELHYYPLEAMSASFINGFVWRLYERLEKKK